MHRPLVVIAILSLLSLAGCASTSDTSDSSAGTSGSSVDDSTGNPVLDKDPYEVTCGDLQDNGGAPNIAREVAGDITDPELSLGETEDVIATALALTCTTQRRSYMPVDDVLNGVQAGGNMPDDGSSTGLF